MNYHDKNFGESRFNIRKIRREAIDSSLPKVGGTDECVNCAGVGHTRRPESKSVKAQPLRPFEQVIKINLIGTVQINPAGETKQRNVFPNTPSVAVYDERIGEAVNSASTTGTAGMTLPIARYLGVFGIRIVTIAPRVFGM